jgi:hypothetical protein
MNKFLYYILYVLLLIAACTKKEEQVPASVIVTNDLTLTMDENPVNGTVLGTVDASSDAGAVTFTISSSTPEGAFAIDENSGRLSVADKYQFDYEKFPVLTALISITDGISTVTSTATINLNDLEFVWTGDKITFYKPANADTALEAFQDRITENVWLTRGSNGVLINKAPGAIGCEPGNVKMAYGLAADRANLTFSDCMEKLEGSELKELPGKDVVFYLVADDIYLDVHFLSWSSQSSGGQFSYERSTPN